MADIAEADKKFSDFCGAQFRSLTPAPPPILYHYTTAAGMRGIIKSGSMRATHVEFLNDYTEIRYAASIFRAHLDRGYATEPSEEACRLFRAIRMQIGTMDTQNLFVLSFVGRADELPMWRLYADRGTGFSFAFPFHEAASWGGFPMKCQYEPAALNLTCCVALSKIREIYLGDVASGSSPDTEEYARMFLRNIAWFAPMFKPQIWADEDEWRLVFMREKRHHKTDEHGRLYVDVPGLDDSVAKLPIRAICAGPHCGYQESILPLQTLMKGSTYQDVPIHISQHKVQ
jgi:hypothetical protein